MQETSNMPYANAMIGQTNAMSQTNALCNHCAPICYWQTLNHWPRYQFSMNANKMWCKSKFFIFDANAFWQRCKCNFLFMMQMSHARMKMQSLFMMMLVHSFKPWCKCLLTEMEVRMSSNGYVMMQMSLCRNVMMQMFWPKHKLFKNSFYFQNKVSSAPEKIFSKLDLLFLKSHPLFDLRLPKIGDHC